jgi:hypothetical protein
MLIKHYKYLGNECFIESNFLEIIFKIILCLFNIRKVSK